MRIKLIAAGAVIALAGTVGSASAADQFKVLHGIDAIPLSGPEMEAVRGMDVKITSPAAGQSGATLITLPDSLNVHVVANPSATPVATITHP